MESVQKRINLFISISLDGWEMYDLEKDPNELNSVYGQARIAALTKELKEELNRLRKLYKVPG
jgi:hypothetical protein